MLTSCQPVNWSTGQCRPGGLACNFLLHNIPFGFKIFFIAESYLLT